VRDGRCPSRMKINPAPGHLAATAQYLAKQLLIASLDACLESRHNHTSPTAPDVRAPLPRVDTRMRNNKATAAGVIDGRMSRPLTACRWPFALCRLSRHARHSAVRFQAWPKRKGAHGRDLPPSARGFLHGPDTALEGPHMAWRIRAGLAPDDSGCAMRPAITPGQQALEVGRDTDMHQVKGKGASIVRSPIRSWHSQFQ